MCGRGQLGGSDVIQGSDLPLGARRQGERSSLNAKPMPRWAECLTGACHPAPQTLTWAYPSATASKAVALMQLGVCTPQMVTRVTPSRLQGGGGTEGWMGL